VIADQSRFGAADGRYTKKQPEVGSEPETARVSNALTVEENHIGPSL